MTAYSRQEAFAITIGFRLLLRNTCGFGRLDSRLDERVYGGSPLKRTVVVHRPFLHDSLLRAAIESIMRNAKGLSLVLLVIALIVVGFFLFFTNEGMTPGGVAVPSEDDPLTQN